MYVAAKTFLLWFRDDDFRQEYVINVRISVSYVHRGDLVYDQIVTSAQVPRTVYEMLVYGSLQSRRVIYCRHHSSSHHRHLCASLWKRLFYDPSNNRRNFGGTSLNILSPVNKFLPLQQHQKKCHLVKSHWKRSSSTADTYVSHLANRGRNVCFDMRDQTFDS